MNNLDDLIRTSLHAHTASAAPDETLAGRAAATGRRIRRTRNASVAALALVAVLGIAWGSGLFPRAAQGGILASPAPSRPSTSAPTSSPSPTAPTTRPTARDLSPTVRDVSAIGSPGEIGKYTVLNNFFASPTGNLECFINQHGAGCVASFDAGVIPRSAERVCSVDGSVEGPAVWGAKRGEWACGSDKVTFPYLGPGYEDGTAWWDASFGESIPYAGDPSLKVAVLPYGKTLVAGDFRCSMATTGVTCLNTRTHQGFLASRAKVDLTP